ncbi:MAG: hypothetical protein IKR41_04465 [Bacteroidales bacterium]|nr:hypothetical protein [Bacteroidales bacterium]
MMKTKIFFPIFLAFFCLIVSCNTDTDFSTLESDCQIVEIIDKAKTLTLEKDTAWYVSSDNSPQFYCDKHKITTFFNVLRDLQLQGLSSYDEKLGFEFEIRIKKKNGKVVKTLGFNPVPNSPQLIGSCNGGKCYIVAIPGLQENPSCNFSTDPGYWKNLSLLDLVAEKISFLKVVNYIDTLQSFSIKINDNAFLVQDFFGKEVDASQSRVRGFLGSLSGVYRAKEYFEKLDLDEKDKIFSLSIETFPPLESIGFDFYKKYSNGKPDFNLMYFKTDVSCGTVTYYDFERFFIELNLLIETEKN